MPIKITSENSLESLGGDILREYDTEKNMFKTSELYKFSCEKVWWKCLKYGHSWEAVVHKRTRSGNNCPYCGNQKPLKGFNTLEDKYPELAKEFSIERNKILPSEVISGSHWKVWWKCSDCKHEWESSVKNRIDKNSGCPKCDKRGTSYIEQLLYHAIKDKFPETKNRYKINGFEYDIFVESLGLVIEYQGEYWHKIIHNRELNDKKKKDNAINLGLKMLTITETSEKVETKLNDDDILIKHKDALSKSKEIVKLINTYIKKEFGIEISIEINHEIKIDAKSNSKKVDIERSLAYKFPELVKEWDYEKNGFGPDEVSYGSSIKANWICSENKEHKWVSKVSLRTCRGFAHKCPMCIDEKRWGEKYMKNKL